MGGLLSRVGLLGKELLSQLGLGLIGEMISQSGLMGKLFFLGGRTHVELHSPVGLMAKLLTHA